MILNKWLIFRVILSKPNNDYTWTVQAAKYVGDIFLRTMVEDMDIVTALRKMELITDKEWDYSHLIRTKTKITLVYANNLDPFIVLTRDGSWR